MIFSIEKRLSIRFPLLDTIECFRDKIRNIEAISSIFDGGFGSEDGFEDLGEALDADGLGDDLVDFAGPGTLDVVVLDVPGAGHDHRLGCVVVSVEVSDALGLFEAVHHGHAYVCEDQTVDVGTGFEPTLDLFQCFEAVEGSVDEL